MKANVLISNCDNVFENNQVVFIGANAGVLYNGLIKNMGSSEADLLLKDVDKFKVGFNSGEKLIVKLMESPEYSDYHEDKMLVSDLISKCDNIFSDGLVLITGKNDETLCRKKVERLTGDESYLLALTVKSFWVDNSDKPVLIIEADN